ncbi:nitric oxide dioxygenase [Luteibacter sp. Sphag1AF]|uniref:NO-inducible flavohemoprotein n=1 Tax=Luteibacter sp. Sphag1AF TaxID=2587031 RepID=UPI001607F906|nr:NO-inducible flavohemoprotein [Luteibacter sp. Sphag1AF]MBB3226500.1 nitric oxide dioxygenase [Luteibacter sp. Sphag1AF]
MLSPEHRAIVRATVPLLETGSEVLARHFYRTLLAENPQVRAYFNPSHQHSGAQQRALARAVLAYARHIDQLDVLADLVRVIVCKHVAMQVPASLYPVVGATLLRSIREVLGHEVATDAVLDAWGAAYGQLAALLVEEERKIYDSVAKKPGGWRGARQFVVVAKTRESSEVTSLTFAPDDNGPVMLHEPGQHIGLRVDIDGVETRRNYAISSLTNGSTYRISVKRQPGGVVSGYLHDRVNLGDTLELFPPSGDFVLQSSGRPLVLISGGIGITATLPMLESALAEQRPVHFIHAARHACAHAFRIDVEMLASEHAHLKHYTCYELHDQPDNPPDATGLVDSALLAAWMPATRDVDVYVLGPIAFMKAMKAGMDELGIPAERTRYGFYGPATALD